VIGFLAFSVFHSQQPQRSTFAGVLKACNRNERACILGTSIRGLGIKHPNCAFACWKPSGARCLVSVQTITHRNELDCDRSHFKVQGAWGSAPASHISFRCGSVLEIKTPANAPAENPGCTSRQTGCGRVALGTLQVWYGTATARFSRAHGDKWRQMARCPRAGSATRQKLTINPRGGEI